MTPSPAQLAGLHAEAFDSPWDETAFADLLSQTGVFAVAEVDGFILMRAVADEAEIITLAVRPEARRLGLGGRLVGKGVLEAARRGAERVFLEVADGNTAALGLYALAGFESAGVRKGYYSRSDGTREDARVLMLMLANRLP